ncbi:unnamed protein product [Closterium sp. NIES-53]
MTLHADLLTELEPSPVKHVTSALGQRAEVKVTGKAMFKGADGKMVGLKNVLWVPNLAANLIPVRRLQKAGMDTSSKGAKTYTARLGERILWDLHEDRDVYNEIKLGEHEESGAAFQKQHKGEENPKAAAEEEYGENMWGTIASAAFSNPTSATRECDWLTLHRQMGHVALPILQQIVKNEMVAGICVKGEPDEVLGCPTCMQTKFTRYPFSSSKETAMAPLDEVVMDVVGPLKLGAAGAEYLLTIVDIYTRRTWVYVLSKKSNVAETVKTDWLPMVERQQDRLVKAIRTDRGGVFLSKEFSLWLKKNGIRHSLTMPYSPAINGIAERANRTITETARGLLIEARLPNYFWPDAVRSACVAKNRALTHVGAEKWLPYVDWIGRKPNVDMLRVFECMCMAVVPKHLRHNKLGAKAIWAVHLGMAQNSKGWLLWDPFTKKFLLSSGSKTTRESSLVSGGEEAKDAEEEEEVQHVSERAPTLPSRTTSAPRIRVTPQQRHESLHVPAAEKEGRGKRRIQAPNRVTYEALRNPARSALAGAAMMVGDDEENEYEEFAFAFFSPVEMPGEQATLKEALEISDAEEWKKAMESELKSIEENGTWELVELPKGRKAITSKWLFKIKTDADGKIERYNSRLVAKGYQQKEKVDYKELFAPVEQPTTLRTLLAGATMRGWVVKQMDMITAFLNGVLEEKIFMAQPEGFDDGIGRVWKLRKVLYGLKQAPRQWYLKLREDLEEIGFTPSYSDHSLFMLGEGGQRSFMVVYVDDILTFSPSSDLVKEVMLKLQDKFKCMALGDVSFCLGLHIERDVEKRCMRVHQRKYLEALAANFCYHLQLPPHMTIHPVFHVHLLRPYRTPSHPFQPRPPMFSAHLDLHEVDTILSHHDTSVGREYLIHWRNTSASEDSWEPFSDLSHTPRAIGVYLASLAPRTVPSWRGGNATSGAECTGARVKYTGGKFMQRQRALANVGSTRAELETVEQAQEPLSLLHLPVVASPSPPSSLPPRRRLSLLPVVTSPSSPPSPLLPSRLRRSLLPAVASPSYPPSPLPPPCRRLSLSPSSPFLPPCRRRSLLPAIAAPSYPSSPLPPPRRRRSLLLAIVSPSSPPSPLATGARAQARVGARAQRASPAACSPPLQPAHHSLAACAPPLQPARHPLVARSPPLWPARRPYGPLAALAARLRPTRRPLQPASHPLEACTLPLAARSPPLAARSPPLAARSMPSGSPIAAPCSPLAALWQPTCRPLAAHSPPFLQPACLL